MADNLYRPSSSEIKEELKTLRYKKTYRRSFRNTICILFAAAGIVILLSSIFFPILRVTGTSMEPTLKSGQLVVAVKNTEPRRGELVAFYFNNRILLKRVIGLAGDQIVIGEDGTVTVNGVLLDEPYVDEKSLSPSELEYPYQVPEGKIFVLGDHRATSVDSRSKEIGCISDEYIIGRIIFSFWPIDCIDMY